MKSSGDSLRVNWPFRSSVTTAILCLATVLRGSFTALAQDVPSIDVIRAGYSESLSLIRTLDCRYELRLIRPEAVRGSIVGYYGIEYASDGNRSATRLLLGYSPDDITHRTWFAFDGTTYSYWREFVDKTQSQPPPNGSLSLEQRNQQGLPFSLNVSLGKAFWGERGRLLDVFAVCTNPAVSRDKVGDINCFLVDFPEHAGPLTTPDRPIQYHTRVWFDPTVGFLPRRIYSEYTFKNDTQWLDCRVESFRHIVDSSSDRGVFIPSDAIYYRKPVDYQMTLLIVAINQDLPASRFTPEFPDGAKITEYRASEKPVIRVVGSRELRNEMEKQWLNSSRELVKTPEEAVVRQSGNTAPHRASGRWYDLRSPWFYAGVVLILIVTVIAWKNYK